MNDKLRWRIAYVLDKLPGQCWADLVTWALDDRYTRRKLDHPWHPWRPIGSTCRSDAAANEGCYCGKLRNPKPPEVTSCP